MWLCFVVAAPPAQRADYAAASALLAAVAGGLLWLQRARTKLTATCGELVVQRAVRSRSYRATQLGPIVHLTCARGPLPGTWLVWSTVSGDRVLLELASSWPQGDIASMCERLGVPAETKEFGDLAAARRAGLPVPWYLAHLTATVATATLLGGALLVALTV